MDELKYTITRITAWFTQVRVITLAILAALVVFIASVITTLEDLGPEKKVETPSAVVDEPATTTDVLDWVKKEVENTLDE